MSENTFKASLGAIFWKYSVANQRSQRVMRFQLKIVVFMLLKATHTYSTYNNLREEKQGWKWGNDLIQQWKPH